MSVVFVRYLIIQEGGYDVRCVGIHGNKDNDCMHCCRKNARMLSWLWSVARPQERRPADFPGGQRWQEVKPGGELDGCVDIQERIFTTGVCSPKISQGQIPGFWEP